MENEMPGYEEMVPVEAAEMPDLSATLDPIAPVDLLNYMKDKGYLAPEVELLELEQAMTPPEEGAEMPAYEEMV